jgi:hypothetical protein
MNDHAQEPSMPAELHEENRRASSSPELLLSHLDQPGIAACRSRLATMLRLMQAMTFDSMRSVRQTTTPSQAVLEKLDGPMLIGMAELLPVDVGGMTARVEIATVVKNDWLQMRIKASCPPMLGPTIVTETIRNDLSNLFKPTDGKDTAIASLRRLLTLVAANETHVAKAMEDGTSPDPTDPARLEIRKHEFRMSSLLTRAMEENEDGSTPNVGFDFCNPYPGNLEGDVDGTPFPVSDGAMQWLESVAPPIVELREDREGISTVYAFGSYEGSAGVEPDQDAMSNLRVRAASSGAPDGILNEAWADDFR